MRCLRALIALALIACVGSLGLAATPAADSFEQGKSLLAQGDLEGALAQYAAAARADQRNAEYMQQYALLRQAIELRRQFAVETDPTRLDYQARALQAFYRQNSMKRESLELAQQAHQRLKTSESAVVLAEAALSQDKFDLAVSTLTALGSDQCPAIGMALKGVALARQGKAADARQVLASLQLASDADPATIYTVARLKAAIGDAAGAADDLTKAMAAVAPSRQDSLREHAKTSPEFAAMASSPAFAAALATPSKVSESRCSGGSNCSTCPMRGKCGGGGAGAAHP